MTRQSPGAPRLPRQWIPGAAPDTVARVDAAASHHLVTVLRLREGDRLEAFDGAGARFDARLERADPHAAQVAIGARRSSPAEPALALTLVQGLPSADKMDWVIEKAVELGVDAIVPVQARHSLVRLDGERAARRLAHWQRLAVAACTQCGRDRLPTIAPVQPWPAACAAVARDRPALLLDPLADVRLAALAPQVRRAAAATVCIGPEAGWSDDERASARAAGMTAVSLGARVLRTETAGLAAIAVLQALAGDYAPTE